MEKLKKLELLLLLILIEICPLIFGVVGIVISTILFTIYIKLTNKHKNFLVWYLIGILLYCVGLILIYIMPNKGIDSLGASLIYSSISALGNSVLMVCPIIILIIDLRKFLLQKSTIIIIILLGLIVFLGFKIYPFIITTKIDENIPTVGDFEKELVQRGFLTDTNDIDYRLYGIKKSTENDYTDLTILSFEKNSVDRYPLYVYFVMNRSWMIYYINGEIYAVRGKYEHYDSHITWINSAKVLSETEEMTVYDTKLNRYQKGNIIDSTGCLYDSIINNNTTLLKSIYIEIPSIDKSFGRKIVQVHRIDNNLINL